MKIIENIKNTIWMWRVQRQIDAYEHKQKVARRRHCRFGHHKVQSCTMTINNEKNKKTKIYYIKCANCNTMFFINKSQKNKYEKMIKDNHNTMN